MPPAVGLVLAYLAGSIPAAYLAGRITKGIDLREHGARVIGVASASEALELLQEQEFDLMISDIGMADIDGYSLIKQIRDREGDGERHIPAIALTAYARAQDRLRAIGAGYNTHVAKPVEIRELVSVVKCLTGKISQ